MYNPKITEIKWQKFWEENNTFRTLSPAEAGNKPKKYVLSMFPYPSGEGLHVGHAKIYTATDAYARYCKTRGYNVLHPTGWDAFGLPAENYAIKTGTHPAITTAKNVANYTRQMKSIGLSYDWSREINTTDVDYMKQTQWIFLQLFERGLAYEQDLPINYCPSCKTGLANEEVVGDNICDRCGTVVERRKIRQWVLKITEYAERLLTDIDTLDWPESIKEMQRNWIGKSEGVEFSMKKVGDESKELSVYTTRIDTVYGMTYVVLAADHKDVNNWITPEQREKCEKYIADSKAKSDLERTNEGKEKTGEFTGSYVINPFNGEQIPVWIGDYVLGSYGTGAVMAVPAHDERDFEFAKKHNLPTRLAIKPMSEQLMGVGVLLETGDGKLILQERDENAPTRPNMITPFGGGRNEGESDTNCALREMVEEVELTLNKDNLIYIGNFESHNFPGKYLSVFYVKGIDSTKIVVHEGKGFIELSSQEALDHEKVTLFTKNAIHALNDWKINEIIAVISPFVQEGILINSAEFTGLSSAEARKKLAEKAESEGFGTKKTNYKLRDWLFSRQRYWGEPIPLIHLEIEDIKKLPHISSISEAADSNLAYILKRDEVAGECVK